MGVFTLGRLRSQEQLSPWVSVVLTRCWGNSWQAIVLRPQGIPGKMILIAAKECGSQPATVHLAHQQDKEAKAKRGLLLRYHRQLLPAWRAGLLFQIT